ncbi:AAA family ATPase [Planctomycetota bacterium]
MQHLLEILKILEGALNLNPGKSAAYAELLAEKLDSDDESSAAARIRRVVARSKAKQVEPNGVARLARLPVDTDSRMSLADEEALTPEDVAVYLEAGAWAVVEQFLLHLQAADLLVAEGVGISPSLLLYGPPGCGKTELGRYIAATVRLPLLTARTDGLISSYLGNTAKNLRALFEHAMHRPCVLFLDEFDALAKLRDDQYEVGELKRVVVSLLQNIDALGNGTVLVAATNHEHLLDPAVWRRFAYKIQLGKPPEEVRERLFEHFLGSFATTRERGLLASIGDGLTGADIKQLCDDAKRAAIIADKRSMDFDGLALQVIQTAQPDGRSGCTLEERIQRVRAANPRVFTYRRLARLFGVSLGKLSKVLK